MTNNKRYLRCWRRAKRIAGKATKRAYTGTKIDDINKQ